MTPQVILRPARTEDAASLLEIYCPYVEHTAISFEITPPSVEEMAARITKSLSAWQFLVAEQAGRCIGFANALPYAERAAYCWSVTVGIYIHPHHHRQGLGRALYLQLFDDLRSKGYCQAIAGITLPNEKSVGLHHSLGFETVGIYKNIGRKFGRWHDVIHLQKTLQDTPPHETNIA